MNLPDDELYETIFAALRRCPHALLDSVVAEFITTAVIIADAEVFGEKPGLGEGDQP